MVENSTRRPKPDEPRFNVNKYGIGTAKNLNFIYGVLTELVDSSWNSEALNKRINGFAELDTVIFNGEKIKQGGERVWVASTLKDRSGQSVGTSIGLLLQKELVYAGVYLYSPNDLYTVSLKRGFKFKNATPIDALPAKLTELLEKLKV